jgi:glucose-1-phosphate cytidylyltransferase
MKVIIVAGGLGSRISEETKNKPKPMVLINGKPIIWHLMNIFSLQGFNEFIISTGYKSEIIEDWIKNNKICDLNSNLMKIQTINTGLNTQTGGRISEVMKLLPGERVIVTYGDGLANVSIKSLLSFHNSHGKLATVTAVHPPARFGYIKFENNRVTHFGEKNQTDSGWINGGFFVLEPNVSQYVKSINEPFESGALIRLVNESQLMSFQHEGFWQPMDTLREKLDLEKCASINPPPWLVDLS